MFLELLDPVARRFRWSFHALCLMSTHYHLVLSTTRALLSQGMHRLNGMYADAFNDKYGRWGHVFGDRFSCRLVEEERYLEALCRYVLRNPVEAGLCETPADWPWSYSRFGKDLG